MPLNSLRLQLLGWLLVPLAVLVAVNTWAIYTNATETATVVQDRMLLAAGRASSGVRRITGAAGSIGGGRSDAFRRRGARRGGAGRRFCAARVRPFRAGARADRGRADHARPQGPRQPDLEAGRAPGAAHARAGDRPGVAGPAPRPDAGPAPARPGVAPQAGNAGAARRGLGAAGVDAAGRRDERLRAAAGRAYVGARALHRLCVAPAAHRADGAQHAGELRAEQCRSGGKG